jgi:hypothetical protein
MRVKIYTGVFWNLCLYLSSYYGYTNIVQHLLRSVDPFITNLDMNVRSIEHALDHACFRGDVDVPQLLLNNKVAKPRSLRLVSATAGGHAKIVKLQLESGTKVCNRAPDSGCALAHLEIPDMLLKGPFGTSVIIASLLEKVSHRDEFVKVFFCKMSSHALGWNVEMFLIILACTKNLEP